MRLLTIKKPSDMTHLIIIILTSIACVGTFTTIQEFLWTFRVSEEDFNFIYATAPWYYKPIFTCVTCMASVWGTFYYWTITTGLTLAETGFIGNDDIASMVIFWPVTCVSCAFLNTLFHKWIDE